VIKFGKKPQIAQPLGLEDDASLKSDGEFAIEQNAKTASKQRTILYAAIGLVALGGIYYVIKPDDTDKPKLTASDGSKSTKISTDDIANRNLSDKEWMSTSQVQLDAQSRDIKGLQGDSQKIDDLQKKIDGLQGENAGLKTDGTQVLGAYQKENNDLKAQIQDLRSQQERIMSGPNAMYGATGQSGYQRAPGAPAGVVAAGPVVPVGAAVLPVPTRANTIRLISFGGDGSGGTGTKIDKGKGTTFTDSENYLPPNSIATATVVVGVDATTTVKSQGDPLPVVLRITGPARSVYADGKLLRTNLAGCIVNGAAIADLSAEKVYVKLQKMTCPQPNGRVAVSEVKGFIAFGGKAGVRGHVVNRAGNLVGQAFLAGIAGGIGKGFATNSTAFLTQPTVNTTGTPATLSPSDIAMGGIGNGVSNASDRVSKYLIERAEQYQPVVEMPTGIKVEVVFLEGAFIRN
jgi:conjugal transfer pilus assembly protein TraB